MDKGLSYDEIISYVSLYMPGSCEKLKKLLEKEPFLRDKNAYGEIFSERQIELSFDPIFQTEYLRAKILEITSGEAKSVKEISQLLNEKPEKILSEIVELRRKNLINIHNIKEQTPFYRSEK
jgi:hypothetical protein